MKKTTMIMFAAALGVALWNILLVAKTVVPQPIPILAISLYEPNQPTPSLPEASEYLPTLFLTASSWFGAWLTAYSLRFLSPYCREADHLTLLGATQAVLPFLAPLLPFVYWLLMRRKVETRPLTPAEVPSYLEE